MRGDLVEITDRESLSGLFELGDELRTLAK